MNRAWFSTLRGRLAMSYVVALMAALAVFGTGAVFVIDRSLHTSLDERLRTTAQAALNFVDVKDGLVKIDERDRGQLFSLVEPQTDLAVLNGASDVVFSTTAKPSEQAIVRASGAAGFSDLHQGGVRVRVLVLPVNDGPRRIGSVILWTTAQWIEDIDRRVILAFAIAALLLAAVAAVAGGAVTRRALDDAFALQRRFTADASHELRAPLSVIRAEADLALRGERAPETYRTALATIASEADRMERLVSGLLSAARAEHAGERTRVDLQEIARHVCTRLAPAARAKHAEIRLREEPPCYVFGDADALESAATAVLHNAIKYTSPDSCIEVWTHRDIHQAELYVQDAGPGLSASALAHGLEWFWCGDERSADHGSGIGLAVASSVAKSTGGHVSLANAASGGARVLISLPAA